MDGGPNQAASTLRLYHGHTLASVTLLSLGRAIPRIRLKLRAGASCFEQGGVIQGLSAALWELILLGAPKKLAIDPRPIGRQ